MAERLIEKVVYVLHPTFKEEIRTVDKYPFRLTTRGWGVFWMVIIVFFRPHTKMIPQRFNHYLSLDLDHESEKSSTVKILRKDLEFMPQEGKVKRRFSVNTRNHSDLG